VNEVVMEQGTQISDHRPITLYFPAKGVAAREHTQPHQPPQEILKWVPDREFEYGEALANDTEGRSFYPEFRDASITLSARTVDEGSTCFV